MRALLVLLQCGLAAAFLAAATGKVLHPNQLPGVLQQSRAPRMLSVSAAGILPFAEYTIALGLILSTGGGVLRAWLIAAGALLVLFSSWIGWVLLNGLKLSCACFGESHRPVGLRQVFRNAILLLAIITASYLSSHTAVMVTRTSLWELATILQLVLLFTLMCCVWGVRDGLVWRRTVAATPRHEPQRERNQHV